MLIEKFGIDSLNSTIQLVIKKGDVLNVAKVIIDYLSETHLNHEHTIIEKLEIDYFNNIINLTVKKEAILTIMFQSPSCGLKVIIDYITNNSTQNSTQKPMTFPPAVDNPDKSLTFAESLTYPVYNPDKFRTNDPIVIIRPIRIKRRIIGYDFDNSQSVPQPNDTTNSTPNVSEFQTIQSESKIEIKTPTTDTDISTTNVSESQITKPKSKTDQNTTTKPDLSPKDTQIVNSILNKIKKTVSHGTFKTYRGLIYKFLIYVNKPIKDIDNSDFISYQKHVETLEVCKSSYGNRIRTACLVMESIPQTDPFFTFEEVDRLISCSPNNVINILIQTGYECALRREELSRIYVYDVDIEHGVIQANKKMIKVSNDLCNRLKELIGNRSEEKLFPMMPVSEMFSEAKRLANIQKNLDFDALKGSRIYHLIKEGLNFNEVKNKLGINTTTYKKVCDLIE